MQDPRKYRFDPLLIALLILMGLVGLIFLLSKTGIHPYKSSERAVIEVQPSFCYRVHACKLA